MTAKAEALRALKVDYQKRIEAFAEELAPRFKSGKLRGLTDDDMAHLDRASPLQRLEAECERRLANNNVETYLVLMCSSSTGATYDDKWVHPAYHARSAAARDVLRVAFRRGWWCPDPAKGEDPTVEELTKNVNLEIKKEAA